jgi:hypothetical protein
MRGLCASREKPGGNVIVTSSATRVGGGSSLLGLKSLELSLIELE